MPELSVNDRVSQLLPNLGKPLAFRDENGQVIGYYMLTMLASEDDLQISEEELNRREKEGGGRRLADLLADLEKRQ